MLRCFYLVSIALLVILPFSCSKLLTQGKKDDEVIFQYNGAKYVVKLEPELSLQYNIAQNFTGVIIDLPGVFPGKISMQENCIFLAPPGSAFPVLPIAVAGCELVTTGGTPVDSTRVYFYQSGTFNFQKVNCKEESVYDGRGGTDTYTSCEVNGTFGFTVKNKENNSITISGGIIKLYKVHFY